jgi:hypothetical protein
VGIYELSPRITLSATWVYGTGNAITLPLAQFAAPEHRVTRQGGSTMYRANTYGEKNSFRMAAYHRLDAAIQFRKQKQRFERTWELGLYNAYSRQNPFFYYIASESRGNNLPDRNRIKQVSLFPIIPSVSYNFRF